MDHVAPRDEVLTVGQAGEYLGTGERFVRRLVAKRQTRTSRSGSSHDCSARRSALDAFIEAGRIPSESPSPPAPVAAWEATYVRRRREKIVAEHELRQLSMQALLGESHFYADFCFAYGATKPPLPAFVSTVKIKQAGFTEAMDTEESFVHWIKVLQERRVLPPRSR